MKRSRKLFIYKILLIILIIAFSAISVYLLYNFYQEEKFDKENRKLADEFDNSIELFDDDQEEEIQEAENIDNNYANVSNISSSASKKVFKMSKSKKTKTSNLKFGGYNIIGTIEIPAINIKYPILDSTKREAMKYGIIRYYGSNVNEYGNISLAGHSYYNGTMFGKNKKLKIGDSIFLTDLNGTKIEYKIYTIFTVTPDDTSILETQDDATREVTLITCYNGRQRRLIIKAKEV